MKPSHEVAFFRKHTPSRASERITAFTRLQEFPTSPLGVIVCHDVDVSQFS